MPTAVAKVVTSEVGQPGGMVASWDPRTGDNFISASYEQTAELEFPYNLAIYDRMRHEDGQVSSILRALNLPILSTPWRLNVEGVDPIVAQFVQSELGLEGKDKARQRRRRQGIVWTSHLREALLSVVFGFMPFEQLYEVSAPTNDQAVAGLRGNVAHLRKLGPRLPRTVRQIQVARDGGLDGILQAARGTEQIYTGGGRIQSAAGTSSLDDVFIPADQLVMYVNDQEGADWAGNSILRSAYKHWLLKDVLYRVGAQAVERNGMGLPAVTYDGNKGNKAEALEIASNARAGATAGVAMEDGVYKMELLGVTGSVRDELPLVKHHDEAIGRLALAMFLNLGHDNGARSLGETFLDIFSDAENAVADAIADTATEYVIRDLVEINFGPDEPYPSMDFDEINSEGTPTAQALMQLTTAGIITPDDKLEDEMRRRLSLPARDPESARKPAPGAVPVSGDNPFSPSDVAADDAVVEQATDLMARLSELRRADATK